MRVVALVPGGIGDQILFFPTLDDLKRYYPNAQIDVVVEPRSKAAYRVSKSVENVLTFDFKDRNSLADWANVVGMIREHEYDVAIALGAKLASRSFALVNRNPHTHWLSKQRLSFSYQPSSFEITAVCCSDVSRFTPRIRY